MCRPTVNERTKSIDVDLLHGTEEGRKMFVFIICDRYRNRKIYCDPKLVLGGINSLKVEDVAWYSVPFSLTYKF